VSLKKLGTILVWSFLFGVLLVGCGEGKKDSQQQLPIVAIVNYGAHPILDVMLEGFNARLVELQYVDGKNIRLIWKSVDGNVNLTPQVASTLLAHNPNVVVSLTTPVSQGVAKQLRGKVPLVFSGVTDPISAGLVESWDNVPGSGITGTSDRWPYAEQLDLIKQLLPDAVRIGVPYNSGEANSLYAIDQIEPLAKERGLTIVKSVATSIAEVRRAIDGLVAQDVDAIYVASDNTVMAGFQSILKVAYERNIPVIAGESANVEKGALATYSVNYTDVGRSTADLVDRIIKGEDPGDIPVQTFKGEDLYLNLDAAAKMGVQVSEELKQSAIIVEATP